MKIDRRRALAAGGAILSTLALPPFASKGVETTPPLMTTLPVKSLVVFSVSVPAPLRFKPVAPVILPAPLIA